MEYLTTPVEIRELSSQEEIDKLCEWYVADDPISVCLGLTATEWKIVGRLWLSRCIKNGHSFVAYRNGKLIAGIICEHNKPPPELPPEARMDVVIASMDDLEKPLEKRFPPEAEVGRIVMACTKCKYRHMGVMLDICQHLLDTHAWVKNYFVSTSSKYSYLGARSFGMKEVNRIAFKDWEYKGTRPLAGDTGERDAMYLMVMQE